MPDKQQNSEETIPFYPDHVRTELKVAGGLLLLALIIGAVAHFSPVGLGDAADPMNTPAHVKPEWYFLSLYQLLKFIPKTVGAVIPVIAVLLIAVWPFIDRRPDVPARSPRIRAGLAIITLLLLAGLTIWGEVS